MLVAAWTFGSAYEVRGMNDGSRYAAISRLASGKWIKLKTTDNTFYKLSYEDIKKMGISDPSKVKLYGSGGWMLDEDFSKPYVDDLQEIAVYINKGSDGVFGAGDYLLFYGRGTVKWTLSGSGFVHENNPYANYGVYFMTEGEDAPKEMPVQPSVQQTDITFSEFNDYTVWERDSVTIANTGRELFGENFILKNTRSFSFHVPGITSAHFTLAFAARPLERQYPSLTLKANGDVVIDSRVSPTDASKGNYAKARWVNPSGAWNNPSEDIAVEVSYDKTGQTTAFLDYIRLNTTRQLKSYGSNCMFFRNTDSRNRNAGFTIGNAANNHLVFDITDPYNAKKIDAALSGSQLDFGVQSNDTLKEFALVDLSKSFKVPESLGEIKNQNLHGLEQTEMIILAPEPFLSQAEVLAEAHRKNSGLQVTVVQANLIFNEFSSGVPDATAYRRFMKMFYDRAASDDQKPKYLLLFGDGIFDNRFITQGTRSMDPRYYLLTYQVTESVDETRSYGTDDYFGFLDDNEGIWVINDKLDLGIGRFPVSSGEQADNAVNKVISYMNSRQYGSWKNAITFAADDRSANEDTFIHGEQANRLAAYLDSTYPEFVLTKAYEDAYKPATANGQKTYPDCRNKMMNSLKNGCFLFNYVGHGSTTSLTSEELLNINDVNQMSFEQLPLWITATCDFGWFDGVSNSAGEAVFQNKKSGGIALYTTSRVVYVDGNDSINKRIIHNLFDVENRKVMRLGDILKISKNQLLNDDGNKLNYVLLGDPALKLNFPELGIRVDAVNGTPVEDGKVFEFKALDTITLTGRITDGERSALSGFNGSIKTTAFDGKQAISSLSTNSFGKYFVFDDYTSTIFTGNAKVVNGEFTVTFKVPLDIEYSDKNGKINLYAFDETNNQDAQGSFEKFVLNGSGELPDNTGNGPEIKAMYLNAVTFKDGDKVNETPYFVAQVYDEDGINISGSSLGHEISIQITNHSSKAPRTYTYNLNTYFESTSEIFGEGQVRFAIPPEYALPAGDYSLTFKVWDLLNNSSTDSLNFTVVEGLKPQLFDVLAAGNPAKVSTTFLLSHDRPDQIIDVTIRVYDMMGRICWTHTESGSSDWMKYYGVEWNLCMDNGARLNPGVYVYRAEVSSGSSKEATKAKKIIILGQ